MPETEQNKNMAVVVADQLQRGAELTLKAKMSLIMHRCVAARVSNVTGGVCETGVVEFIPAINKQAARMVYLRKHGDKMVDDVTGAWQIGARALDYAL